MASVSEYQPPNVAEINILASAEEFKGLLQSFLALAIELGGIYEVAKKPASGSSAWYVLEKAGVVSLPAGTKGHKAAAKEATLAAAQYMDLNVKVFFPSLANRDKFRVEYLIAASENSKVLFVDEIDSQLIVNDRCKYMRTRIVYGRKAEAQLQV